MEQLAVLEDGLPGPDHVDLPLQTRMEVRLMPDTAALGARTIEVVLSTGAAVRRRDPWSEKAYDEVLSRDPTHVDLTRLNGGVPLYVKTEDFHGLNPATVGPWSKANVEALEFGVEFRVMADTIRVTTSSLVVAETSSPASETHTRLPNVRLVIISSVTDVAMALPAR